MHKELLLMAFEKARGELNGEGVKSPSTTQCAKKLSAVISEDFPYGERRLRDFYREALQATEEDIEIPQRQVVLALAKYLGYADYRDFESSHFPEREGRRKEVTGKAGEEVVARGEERKRGTKRNGKLIGMVIAAVILAVLGFSGYHYFTQQQWMEWDGRHYIEADFDSQKLQEGSLKAYNEERIQGFERIDPDCGTQFFNADGGVRVWYGKNRDGELQFFTGYGLHPETGKTLKPITEYMIGKYICH